MKKYTKPVMWGVIITLISVLALQLASRAATPKAYDNYVEAVEQAEELRMAYEEAKEELCEAESRLASAKVKDYYNEKRELDSEESLSKLVAKGEGACDAPSNALSEDGNFTPAGGGIAAFLEKNAHPDLKNQADLFVSIGQEYNVKPEVIVAIAQADSSLGNYLRTEYNLGNVFNTETTSRAYSSWEEGIIAIAQTLNNQYLGGYTMIGELSNGGRTDLGLPACGKCYATSEYNWGKNVKAALRDMLKDPTIDSTFKFRI